MRAMGPNRRLGAAVQAQCRLRRENWPEARATSCLGRGAAPYPTALERRAGRAWCRPCVERGRASPIAPSLIRDGIAGPESKKSVSDLLKYHENLLGGRVPRVGGAIIERSRAKLFLAVTI